MPSKEVTNAAKAIYESRNGAGRTPWSQLPWSHKVPYLDDAEAARKSFLAALQEPTRPMSEIGQPYIRVGYDAWDVWRAMLAASALGERSDRAEIISADGAIWDETAPGTRNFKRREQSDG